MIRYILFIIALAVGYSVDASAQFISFDNPSMTREERLIRLQVDKHKIPKQDTH